MVNFQVVHVQEAIYPNARDWKPQSDAIRATLQKILAAKEAGAPVLFSARSHRRSLAWPNFDLERVERPGQASPCTAGRYFVHLEAGGELYPCFQHVGAFRAQNVFRDGVEAAWRNANAHSCFDCYNVWLNENRAIFELQPAVFTNFWRSYLRPRASGAEPRRP
jgi:MoaA/NifB/PqqE/SkfB family radical SAM enzyme